jgi:hypothetical protein
VTNLPDTKMAMIVWAQGHADLPAGMTVAGATSDTLASNLPYAAVFRPPGPPAMHHARWDRALLHVQVWAATEQAARDGAAALYDIAHEAPGSTVPDVDPDTLAGVVIGAVEDVTGLGAVDDPGYPDLYRYTFTVDVRARWA